MDGKDIAMILALGGGESEEQVQVDWNQSDNTQADFIKNKPTIPSEYILPIATTSTLGGIKPDGTTITVDENGVASASGGGSNGWTVLTTGVSFKNSTISLPSEYNELLIIARYNGETFHSIVPKETFNRPSGSSVNICIGGYYRQSNDYGCCRCYYDITNRTIKGSNFISYGYDQENNATIEIYYR